MQSLKIQRKISLTVKLVKAEENLSLTEMELSKSSLKTAPTSE